METFFATNTTLDSINEGLNKALENQSVEILFLEKYTRTNEALLHFLQESSATLDKPMHLFCFPKNVSEEAAPKTRMQNLSNNSFTF